VSLDSSARHGSIPNEDIKTEGYWAGFGNYAPGTSRFGDQPMKTTEWLDRLPDYWAGIWKSKAGLPVVCVPGCPIGV
jgi:hydrogenase small subunit